MELIKREARIDEEEEELQLGSPTTANPNATIALEQPGHDRWEHDRLGSSSPEPLDPLPPQHSTTTRDGVRIPSIRRPSLPSLHYSGDDFGPYSDFSDTPSNNHTQPFPFGSLLNRKQRNVSRHETPYSAPLPQQNSQSVMARNASQASGFHAEQDEERVIWHGYLLCLKTKGGVRQWKRLWVVLRPKNLAFYKNDEVSFFPGHFRVPWITGTGIADRLCQGIRCQPNHSSFKHHQCRRN